jgi:hypothetical protein
MPPECALTICGCEDGVSRPVECDKEGVSLRVDLATAVRRERLSQDALMRVERLPVSIAQLLEEVRGSFDVRKQKRRDCAARAVHCRHDGLRGLPRGVKRCVALDVRAGGARYPNRPVT